MKPRWLANENLPLPAVLKLRGAGWDVYAVAEGAASSADTDVMALAKQEGRWLATFDRDYGELVFRRRLAAPPLILLFRVTSYLPEQPADWIEALYGSGLLIPGHFHIYDGTTLRRRTLP